MRIAFIGDVHGCVLHALEALVAWQRHRGLRLDAAIQVGDLGAYPTPERMDAPSKRFAAENPAQNDLFRLLAPPPELEAAIRHALILIPPVVFVSGNHEDFDWLAGLHEQGRKSIDPCGAFRHVPCGRIETLAGQQIAFLGRIEAPGHMDLDDGAYATLMQTPPGEVDILVTHDGPYGLCRTFRGETAGSPKLSRLIAHLRPRLHVGGHYHHINGPRHYGPTTSYALAQLVSPKSKRVAAGSIGVLDTETFTFDYLLDDWLAEVRGDFDLSTP